MLSKIKKLSKYSILKYVYYNYFCKNVERHNGAKLYPEKNSIIQISKNAKLILDGNLHINFNKLKGSKAEGYLVLNGTGRLHIKGDVFIRYSGIVQVNDGASAEFGSFSCNVGLNIQCNTSIRIGDDCMFGRNVVIYDSAYHPTGTDREHMVIGQAPVKIGNHVWLGTNAMVLYGSNIDNGAIIGANAVISGDVSATAFVAPKIDKPSVSGIFWAKSMDAIDDALKYVDPEYSIIEDFNIDDRYIEEIQKKILYVLKNKVGDIDFENEKKLVDERIFDSLTLVTVVTLLSDEFGIDIPFTVVTSENFNSIEHMARLIAALSSSKEATDSFIEDTETSKLIMEPLQLYERETEKPVVQRIFEHATKEPNDIAIIANEKETSYQELTGMILSIRNWLMEQGVKTGDCVAVQAMHEDICIACYYAIHLSGAILVPMEKAAAQDRLREIAEDTKSVLIISKKKEDCDIPWTDYGFIRSISTQVRFEPEIYINYPDIELPCEMIFTTGTTGKSKGVLMTHRHMSWYAYSIAKCVEMKKGNRFFITTPLNHAGGLRRTHLSLANGCCVVYIDGLSDLGKYFDYIRKYKVTSLYLPPVAIRILLTRTGVELSKYRDQIDFVYSSSSALPAGDCTELAKLLPHTRLYNAYEASETPGVSAYNYNTETVLKNCMGKANPGVELGILLEDGSFHQNQWVEGQICVRSKMNMKEYYHEPELTATVWKDGWFVSSDIGTMDEAGNVYYQGRKGDVINIGGYKIAPTEVEETALLSGMINECICVEAVDEFKVPFLKLLVVVENSKAFYPEKLLHFMSEKLEAYKIPRKVELVDEISKTFNGKLDRKAYR